MKTKVFYGEYTLSHWVDLLLSRQIELPEYQRLFVWKKDKVSALIQSLKENEYVPPVTIGQFSINGQIKNYIIDGQQRLTSLLLAVFDVFPRTIGEIHPELLMNEDDELVVDAAETVVEWRFDKLFELGSNYSQIERALRNNPLYESVEFMHETSFFKNNYLGFTYIVPDTIDNAEQMKYYASVFRNINVQGQRLLEMESRRSLYFLDNDKKDFFEPGLSQYYIKGTTEKTNLDFVRYMAYLCQYKKCHEDANKVAYGFGARVKRNDYYANYVFAMVGGRTFPEFPTFAEIFPDNNYRDKLVALKTCLVDLEIPTEYTSIIEIDTYFFGIIYEVFIEGKTLDVARKNEFKAEVADVIDMFKGSEEHRRSPGSLKYLRIRLQKSIEIVRKYVSRDEA